MIDAVVFETPAEEKYNKILHEIADVVYGFDYDEESYSMYYRLMDIDVLLDEFREFEANGD